MARLIDGYSNQPLTAEAARKLQSLDLEDKFITTEGTSNGCVLL